MSASPENYVVRPFSELPISDFYKPDVFSVFSYAGHEGIVRTGPRRATGPHSRKYWVMGGNERVLALSPAVNTVAADEDDDDDNNFWGGSSGSYGWNP